MLLYVIFFKFIRIRSTLIRNKCWFRFIKKKNANAKEKLSEIHVWTSIFIKNSLLSEMFPNNCMLIEKGVLYEVDVLRE